VEENRIMTITRRLRLIPTALLGLTLSATALAQVSAEEAARLGRDLTPVGAERAGNASGSIPAWQPNAFGPSQLNMTHARLEQLRQELVKEIDDLITNPEAIKDFMGVAQIISDAQPGSRAEIVSSMRESLTQNASLKRDIDGVLQGRGKNIDSILSGLSSGSTKFTDFADDIIAVMQAFRGSNRNAFSALKSAFDIGAVLSLLAEITDPKASAAASELLMRYMPDNVKDFLNFKLPDGYNVDPLRPLYVITRDNLDQHRDKLTDGHLAMFATYPTYKMVVYPSVRNAFFPQEIYDATRENATRASLSGTDNVSGARLGFPFPIPQSGAEVIWNHKMKFRGSAVQRYNNQAIVRPDGSFSISKLVEDVKFVYANLKEPAPEDNRMIVYYLSETLSPPRVAGQITLVHEQIGPGATARNAWLFSPGLGRVNRAPDVGYDNPAIGSDGEQFYDQVDVFNGALDRYNWRLIGKKEMLIPYNSWVLNSPTFKYADLIRPGHMNQDLTRYELHRVWVVEATLRQGQRHQLAKRVFYVDEDSWSIAAVDGYDNRGQLWKFQEAHLLTLPFIPTVSGIPEVIYDLQTKRYFITTMTNEDPISDFETDFDARQFTPAALQRRARTR
jgi:hypothetical protein